MIRELNHSFSNEWMLFVSEGQCEAQMFSSRFFCLLCPRQKKLVSFPFLNELRVLLYESRTAGTDVREETEDRRDKPLARGPLAHPTGFYQHQTLLWPPPLMRGPKHIAL